MKIRFSLLVFFLIIISVFFTPTQANNQNLTYADGYQAGKKAAKIDVRNEGSSYFSTIKHSTLPDHRIEQIKNKPSTYQRGFRKGYKEGVKQALAGSPNYWGSTMLITAVVAALPWLLIAAFISASGGL